jgi:hypothetical protein
MKKHALLLLSLFLVLLSCNTKQVQENALATPTPNEEGKAKKVSYEEFKNMSVEERWHSFSAARRNWLRENPNKYPYFKPMIAQYPDMEEEAPRAEPINYESLDPNKVAESTNPTTLEDWWNSFSEKRKAYMRANPEKYPEFQPYF